MTKSDLDEVLTMAFMRGAESVGLQALEFAERLSTHPDLSDGEIAICQRMMHVFVEQLANGLANASKEVAA